MSDAPPPIPNPPVHPGALRAPDFDYAKLELRTLAAMLDGGLPVLPWQQEIIDRLGRQARIAIDPAAPGTDKTVVIVGDGAELFILDEFDMHMDNGCERRWAPILFGDHEISGTFTTTFENEEALRALLHAKPEQPAEVKPDNRKQRRIDAAKERRKPRGQRKRMIMDIETYDPNRAQDWKHNGPRGTRTDIAWR